MKTSSPQVDDKYQTESDARTLTESQEIRGDAKRHGKALAHLKKKAEDASKAVEMEAEVKKGLAEAFPASPKENR